MNKKFSTLLTASLLMVGALFSSAQAQTPVDLGDKATEVSSGSMYYIVQQNAAANLAASTDFLMGMSKTGTTLAPLAVAAADNSGVGFTISSGVIENYLWTVTAADQEGGKYYTLKNVKTGAFLAVDKATFGASGIITAEADAVEAKNVIRFSFGADADAAYESETGANLVPKGGAATNSLILAAGSITFGADNSKKVILYSVKTQPVAAADLNAAFGGAGFSFAPDGVEVEDNIFDQSIKAFDVADDIELEVGVRAIKKGTYFATSYPDELAEEDAITTAEQFDACTFIAVSPTSNFKTSKLPQGSGAGFKFVTVKGDDLNTYISGDNLSSKEEIFVGNAAFTVTEPNEYAKPGKYTMSLSARVLADPKTTTNKDQNHAAKSIDVIATAIQDVNYITTTVSGEGSLFKVASTKLVKAVSLLKEEKAPSVFNIQFVSGKGTKDSEYNKYMGVAIASDGGTAFELVAQGSALAALNTPQYQFVISAIDTKTQTITFKNLETAVTFTSTLFETENEGEYKLVGVATEASPNLATIEVAKDDKTGYEADKTLEGKVITLNAVEVDPFAGFAVKDQASDAVILKFAKSAALNAEKLYIGVDETTSTATALFDKESKAIKVKFIPVEEADKPNGTAQTYCYNKDGKVYTASQKMVTYYSYYAQIIDGEDNDSYLKIGSNLEIETVSSPATPNTAFVIKENKDGSISLFVSTAFAHATNAKAVKSEDGTAISVDGIAYGVEKADAIKLYLVGEELGVSLEAEPRHASFQSTTGGYISLNEKNEGVVAVKTAADADLTFWLDTADSKAAIPSFYISRRGATADAQRLYMFNVTDSVDNAISDAKKAEYQWYEDINKVIFKAATLVNSDTLSTTVNGKEVLVTTNADQNKGILGGLNNFKYQILKVADTDDEYYIRNMADGDYLVSYNGLLTLDNDRAKAIKVVLEAGESPVANDAINVSAVSVIATDGAIIIKGAEGKKVAISNVLGQTIANTVVTSSEATIAAPAGVVVIAVEGEAAVKAIVK